MARYMPGCKGHKYYFPSRLHYAHANSKRVKYFNSGKLLSSASFNSLGYEVNKFIHVN